MDVLVPEPRVGLIREVEALFAEWERTMTRFSPASELSRLNDAPGRDVPVSDLLFAVVQAAVDSAVETDGLFDPTMLRQLETLGYDRTFSAVRARDHGEGERSRPRTAWPGGGWRGVVLDSTRRTVRLPDGVAIDLGGIAKGMAVDAAVAFLGAAGCARAAVNAGGDLAVLGLPPGEPGWPVLIELPEGGRPEGGRVIRLDGGALATSGVSRRRWRWDGRDVHHLLDPRTGLPARSGLWSATVVGDTCRAAEVAATVAFVLGSAEGARWLTDRDIDGFLVLPDGSQIEVGAWGAALDAGPALEIAPGAGP